MSISLRMWLWCIALSVAAWIILIRAVEEAVRAVA